MIVSDITSKKVSKGSHLNILTKCDICEKEKEMEYRTYYKITNKLKDKYYCHKCSRIKVKKTNLEKYGGVSPMNSKKTVEKMIKTNLEKYGVEHSSQLDEFKEKQKITNNEKYGYDTPLQDIELRKKGMVKKYGVEFPLQHKTIKDKFEKTNIEKYGVRNVWKNKEIREKIKKTNIEKYGFEIPSMSVEIMDKINETKRKNLIDKYKKYNVIDYDMKNKELIIHCEKNHKYKIFYTMFYHRIKLNTELCTICNPISSYSNSGYEIQLQDFIKENYKENILFNDRSYGKELDIYIPELKLAFEFNGIYWHNELNKPNNYHLNKTEICEENNIQLIHIYEDDWIYKNDIVKSMILNKLGKTENKIYGRKCEIREIIDNKLVREFLGKNHIQGFIGSSVKVGLFYENELVSLMIFGKRFSGYELLRFCNKLNTNVVDAENKLFKYFIENYKPKLVTTYSDRSWSRGNLYKKLGFEFVEKTEPNYYYVIDGIRHNKFNYRKDKLVKEGFSSNKTEHEIMMDREIYRIYDSGNLKFELHIHNKHFNASVRNS